MAKHPLFSYSANRIIVCCCRTCPHIPNDHFRIRSHRDRPDYNDIPVRVIVIERWESRRITTRTPSRHTHKAFSQSSGKFRLPPESYSARFRLYSGDHQIFAAMHLLPSWLPPVTESIRPPTELVLRSSKRSPDANRSSIIYKFEFPTPQQSNLV